MRKGGTWWGRSRSSMGRMRRGRRSTTRQAQVGTVWKTRGWVVGGEYGRSVQEVRGTPGIRVWRVDGRLEGEEGRGDSIGTVGTFFIWAVC